MSKDDIIRMAREAGFPCDEDWVAYGLEGFERFAALVAAAEREECAQVASQGTSEAVQTRTLEILQSERHRIATAIRARGVTDADAV